MPFLQKKLRVPFMSMNVNLFTMPNIKVKWYNKSANNGLNNHLCSNAARLKIYKLITIYLVIQFAKSQLLMHMQIHKINLSERF